MVTYRSIGIYLLLAYAAYNAVNILYLYMAYSTVWMLLSIAFVFFIARFIKLLQNKDALFQSEILGYLLVFFVVVVVVLQNIFHVPFVDMEGVEIVSTVTTISSVSILWFFIGGAAALFEAKKSDLIAVSLCLATALAMYFATDENLTIPFKTIVESSGVEGVNHLTLERHIILLIVFAYSIAARTKMLCVAIGATALFFMGGRTSLFVFLIAAMLLAFRGNILRNLISAVAISLLMVVTFQYSVLNGYVDLETAAIREILLLDGVAEDSSYQARVQLYQLSLPLLSEQLWIGNFSLSVDKIGSMSGYVHNLLSAWQFYGFFVFFALIICLVYSSRRMIIMYGATEDPANVFGAFMLIYVLISVVLAKYVGWNLLWFALGFCLLKPPLVRRVRSKKRRKRSLQRYV